MGIKIVILKMGSKWGSWTVIGNAPTNKFKRRQYTVKCECGFIRNHEATALKRGLAVRCKECSYKRTSKKLRDLSIKNEIGKNYGGWTVIEFAGINNNRAHHLGSMYVMQHFCGTKKTPRDFYHAKRGRISCHECKKKIPSSPVAWVKAGHRYEIMNPDWIVNLRKTKKEKDNT